MTGAQAKSKACLDCHCPACVLSALSGILWKVALSRHVWWQAQFCLHIDSLSITAAGLNGYTVMYTKEVKSLTCILSCPACLVASPRLAWGNIHIQFTNAVTCHKAQQVSASAVYLNILLGSDLPLTFKTDKKARGLVYTGVG